MGVEYHNLIIHFLSCSIGLYRKVFKKVSVEVLFSDAFFFSLTGIDRELAYTMKDTRGSGLKGDRALKSQVSVPKDKLGYCAPLAHQTNGKVKGYFSFSVMLLLILVANIYTQV